MEDLLLVLLDLLLELFLLLTELALDEHLDERLLELDRFEAVEWEDRDITETEMDGVLERTLGVRRKDGTSISSSIRSNLWKRSGWQEKNT